MLGSSLHDTRASPLNAFISRSLLNMALLQHLESVWGDPFTFRPERWLDNDAKQLEQSYIPFSVGPRSCVGRNLAMLELLKFIGTFFYRYDFELANPKQTTLRTSEGFLRKPTESFIKIRRRE